MEVLKQKIVKANKEHRCNFCGGKIMKGVYYDKQTNRSSDGLYDWKTHIRCAKIAIHLDMYEGAIDGIDYHVFVDWIISVYYEIACDLPDYPTSFFDKLNVVCINKISS